MRSALVMIYIIRKQRKYQIAIATTTLFVLHALFISSCDQHTTNHTPALPILNLKDGLNFSDNGNFVVLRLLPSDGKEALDIGPLRFVTPSPYSGGFATAEISVDPLIHKTTNPDESIFGSGSLNAKTIFTNESVFIIFNEYRFNLSRIGVEVNGMHYPFTDGPKAIVLDPF